MTGSLFMPVWTDAYLGDTRHLTTVQHGAYLLLLMAMWRNGGTLPVDEKRIARITGLPLDKWRKVSPEIMEFMTIEGGHMHQKRLRLELEKSLSVSEKRKVAGKNGGTAKSLKYHDMAVAIASDLAELGSDKNVASNTNTNTNTPKRQGGGNYPSSTACLIPHAGPSAEDDRQGLPIGMDDLTGLEGLDQAGDDFAGPTAGPLPVEPGPAQPKRREAKRGTRIPEGWELGEAETAVWTKLGLPAGKLQFQWAKFTNHFRSASGPRAIKIDWLATWRNWCLTEFERSPQAAAVFGETGPAKDKWGRPLGALKISGAV